MEKKLASLINDFEFEQIELSLKEPNIFKALSIERKEIRHSNFLAYILNPNENQIRGNIFELFNGFQAIFGFMNFAIGHQLGQYGFAQEHVQRLVVS